MITPIQDNINNVAQEVLDKSNIIELNAFYIVTYCSTTGTRSLRKATFVFGKKQMRDWKQATKYILDNGFLFLVFQGMTLQITGCKEKNISNSQTEASCLEKEKKRNDDDT